MKNGFVLCITLFVAATAAAHGPRDIQCVYNSDCLDPLVCASSLCRIQCKNDRDCVNGWVCRSLRLIDVPPGATSVPAIDETQNRCVAPGAENLARVVATPRGPALQFLPVLQTQSGGATVTAVPAAATPGASAGYAIPQGSTPQVADSQSARAGTNVLQAPISAVNPGINVRRVYRAGALEFRRGERDDFLYMRQEGGDWTTVGAGELTTEPAAIAIPDGAVFVFGKGKDDAIWGVRCNGATCGDWFSLGGVLTSGPTVKIQPDGQIRVIATGTDGRPWFITGDGNTWSGWSPQ
ncbi:MAG: hypothetical protein M3Q69_14180 [Acidobacteriota bacterium]|nr:hypothetical protein [Acidobacteriota bacterium]